MSKEQYDKIADEYSEMLNLTKRYVLTTTFKKIIGDVENKSVLDLGCGAGYFTRILATHKAKEVAGVDISPKLIQKAVDHENQDPLGIKYIIGNVFEVKIEKKFDLVTAAYLLNYSKTKQELFEMCSRIIGFLDSKGKFCALTTNPTLKPMKEFEYERRFVSVDKKSFFEDGDRIRCDVREKGKKPFEFISYYWSKETYEKCLKKAGFKMINWVEPIISKEGIDKYGKEYWEKYQRNSSSIGLICMK
ncbi:hypothetical protein AYK26_03505 [Euryarchaeota archaeon SM23-78]|nr:MAG: hypothetical protein AYK26_03505 [Euryarchaeota archaeon SM23-78]MBW3000562.1 class I SAM-dependent methyltransferase [Candidatus Woesearchaeota archaeon]